MSLLLLFRNLAAETGFTIAPPVNLGTLYITDQKDQELRITQESHKALLITERVNFEVNT